MPVKLTVKRKVVVLGVEQVGADAGAGGVAEDVGREEAVADVGDLVQRGMKAEVEPRLERIT